MIQSFHGIDIDTVDALTEQVFENDDELPAYDELDDWVEQFIWEGLTEDDWVLEMITLRQVAYERSEAGAPKGFDPHGNGDDVLEREVFRAAEWLDSSIRLYIRGRVEQLLAEARDAVVTESK